MGRCLSNKTIKFNFMRILRHHCGDQSAVSQQKISEKGAIFFRFYHELGVQRILDNGPWSFKQNTLVLTRVKSKELPQTVNLNKAMSWVKAYNLPAGFILEHVAKGIGEYVGTFVDSDPDNYNSIWRTFLRVRVELDVKASQTRDEK